VPTDAVLATRDRPVALRAGMIGASRTAALCSPGDDGEEVSEMTSESEAPAEPTAQEAAEEPAAEEAAEQPAAEEKPAAEEAAEEPAAEEAAEEPAAAEAAEEQPTA
jgi:hypothetical protein